MVGVTPLDPELRVRGLGAHARGLGRLPWSRPASGLSPRSHSRDTWRGHPERTVAFLRDQRPGVRVRTATPTQTPCAPLQCCSGLTGCPGRVVLWADRRQRLHWRSRLIQ